MTAIVDQSGEAGETACGLDPQDASDGGEANRPEFSKGINPMTQPLQAEELLAVLDTINWKSADRDNMEFSALITTWQMSKLRAAVTALRLSSEQARPGDELVWLVEFPSSGDAYKGGKRIGPATPTQYYCAIPKHDKVLSRTADPNEAMRFSRKQDAEAMVARLDNDAMFQVGVPSGGFASEHMWMGEQARPVVQSELADELERLAREKGGAVAYRGEIGDAVDFARHSEIYRDRSIALSLFVSENIYTILDALRHFAALSSRPVVQQDEGMVERVAEAQLAAFLAGRGSVTLMQHGTRTAKPAPTMDDFRNVALAALSASHIEGEG